MGLIPAPLGRTGYLHALAAAARAELRAERVLRSHPDVRSVGVFQINNQHS